ncbi:unnamed protein product [Phaedon cochleariae]|uniref:Uncharacterized protein n=1 Tax=Phaedon cochleariae TaxID=80249 RepID=A0A9P0GUE8_PHACE|nr:unnamed protein product [Phaedon cochleariae]
MDGPMKRVWKRKYLFSRKILRRGCSDLVGRPPIGISCERCKYSCSKSVDNVTRNTIFEHFWNLEKAVQQREYIADLVERHQPEKGHPRKRFTQTYTLRHAEECHKVCKKFFISTLGISERIMRTALEKGRRRL